MGSIAVFIITFFAIGATVVEDLSQGETNPRFALLLAGDAIVAFCLAATLFMAIIKEWKRIPDCNKPDP